MTPFIVEKNVKVPTPVPCGRCPNCITRRVQGWAFRIEYEMKRCYSAVFITLTYDTLHVPIKPSGYMSLSKKDIQLFIKQLRNLHRKKPLYDTYEKKHVRPKIIYYAAGEYGPKTNRPHYHIILLNSRLDLIQPAWNKGEIHYGETVAGNSIGYAMKYISKPSRIPLHEGDDRQPEFSLMSKKIGSNYINEKTIKYHTQHLAFNSYLTTPEGNKISMPRYYRDKIYTEEQKLAVGYFNRQRIEQMEAEAIQKNPNYLQEKAVNNAAAFKKMYKNSSHNQKL